MEDRSSRRLLAVVTRTAFTIGQLGAGARRLLREAALALSLISLCSACGSQSAINAPSRPEQAKAEPTASLCWYASLSSEPARGVALDELVGRGAIRKDHLRSVQERHVVVGMNDCETIAAWGDPVEYKNNAPPDKFDMTYDYGSRGIVGFDRSGHVMQITPYH